MPLVVKERVTGRDGSSGVEGAKKSPRRVLSAAWGSTPAFNQDIQATIAREAVDDPTFTKTWSRRLVEGFLQYVSLCVRILTKKDAGRMHNCDVLDTADARCY